MKTHRCLGSLAIAFLALSIYGTTSYAVTDVFAVHLTPQPGGTFVATGSDIVVLDVIGGGRFAINAKINLNNDSGDAAGDPRTVTCSLIQRVQGMTKPVLLDQSVVRLAATGNNKFDLTSISLQSPADVKGDTVSFALSCTFTGTGGTGISLTGAGARIQAIRIDGKFCDPSPGNNPVAKCP